MPDTSLLREIGSLQDRYLKKKQSSKLTKKDICEIAVPFRDKYGLTDMETLRIMRGDATLTETANIIESAQERST